MEHGLVYITFYVQNHKAYLVAFFSGSPLVRDGPPGAPAFLKAPLLSDDTKFRRVLAGKTEVLLTSSCIGQIGTY